MVHTKISTVNGQMSEADMKKILFQAALAGMTHALPRHSHYSVGAALITSEGYVFSGGNWERLNPISLGKSNCAEGSMLSSLVSSGVKHDITHIMVMGGSEGDGALCTPCGTCRENLVSFLDEFGRDDITVWVAGPEGVRAKLSMQELLPVRTGMSSFPSQNIMLDVEKAEAQRAIFNELQDVYLEKAYVPYSKYPVAACITSATGEKYYGVTREDAAYSGTSAIRVALSNMILAEGGQARAQELHLVTDKNNSAIVSPSGSDRQALREHCASVETLKIYLPLHQQVGAFTLEELLPKSFGPDHLHAPEAQASVEKSSVKTQKKTQNIKKSQDLSL